MRTLARLCQSASIALLILGIGLALTALQAAAETVDLTPSKDPDAYVPGEAITITFGGMTNGAGYDMTIEHSNGTVLMSLWNNTTSTGTFPWAFNIPADWQGWYYVFIYDNGSVFSVGSDAFYVDLFDLEADANHQVYLPGDTVTIFYYTQRVDNQQPLSSGNGRWRLQIQRDNGSGFVTDNLGESFSPPQGSFTFTLPTTTRVNSYTLYVTYNDTTNMHSETTTVAIRVGTFNLAVSVDRSPAVYQSGESVVVTVSATTSYIYSEPTAGVAVTPKIEKYDAGNATWSQDTSYTIAVQTTSQQGTVSFVVTLRQGIPDDTVLRVFVSAARGGTTQEASAQFTIRAATGLSIDLKLDKTLYKPGETINARLVFISTNATLISGSMYAWRVTNSDTGAVLMEEYVSGTSTGSEKNIAIPSDFIGEIYVSVVVYTPDDRTYSRGEYADVFAWALLLNPAKLSYGPGETMTVAALLVTDRDCGAGGAVFIYTVVPYSGGDPIANGQKSGTGKGADITFTIPSDPDDRYTVNVAASCGGLVAQDSTTVSRDKYVALKIDIPDKSYKPGDTVRIHYEFTAVGGATLPATTTLTVYLYGGSGSLPGGYSVGYRFYEVAQNAQGQLVGDVDFVIPTTAPADGDLLLTVSGGGSGSASSTVFMRASGGASPSSAAANTANWGLIVALIGLFVAVVALMRRPRGPMGEGSDAGKSPSSYSDMKPETVKADAPKSDAPSSSEPPKSL